MRSLADRLITVETGLEGPAARSRFIKTSMRQHVAGPFLFLDADTLPIRPFDGIFRTEAPVSAALDRNVLNPEPHFPELAGRMLLEIGWTSPLSQYFNAGVIYFDDQVEAHALGLEWHRRWRKFYEKFGDHRDQPSLNSAIDALGIRPAVLPIAYIAMVFASAAFARNASILHFFTASGRPNEGSLLDHLVKHLLARGEIDWRAVDSAARSGVVWATGIRWEFAMGRYARAARLIAARVKSKLVGRHIRRRHED